MTPTYNMREDVNTHYSRNFGRAHTLWKQRITRQIDESVCLTRLASPSGLDFHIELLMCYCEDGVGGSHIFGHGVLKDKIKAARWYSLTVIHIEPDAQFFLGLGYMTGAVFSISHAGSNLAEHLLWLQP